MSELKSADYLAIKELKRAKALIELALGDWWSEYTYDVVHDAAETLQRAAWRLGTDDVA